MLGRAALLLVYSATAYTQLGPAQDSGTTSLIRQFRETSAIPAKEQILNRIAQRGGDAGKQLLGLAKTTGDPDTRWLAIRGLGMMKFREAAPFLVDSLRSSEHYVRANAARALGEIRYSPATPSLIDLLRTEDDSGVVQQTALALRMIKARDAIPVLKSRVSSASWQTRCWLLDSIAGLGSDADVPDLAQYLYHTDADNQTATAECSARALDSLTQGELGLPRPGGIYDPWGIVLKARKWWDETGRRRYAQKE